MQDQPSFRENDRVLLRDRPWRVRQVASAAGGLQLIEVEAEDGDYPTRLSVAVPPENVSPMPTEDVSFDLRQLDSLAAWCRAHRILLTTLFRDGETGFFAGARFGRVALEAYQLAPTLRILRKPRPRLLIADDVGLGKTIEAGLAALELIARGRASRILVVTPSGLVDQWREELLDKFGLEFTPIANVSELAEAQTRLPAGTSPWDALARVITSVDFIKKETIRNRALRKRWDLITVDEAHALAESGTPDNPYRTRRTRLGQALRDASRGLLLLTATPHNGYAHAFRSLLELVEPTLATYRGAQREVERRIETARIRRMKSQIKRRLPDGGEEYAFPQRHVSGLPITDLAEPEKELLHKVASYCSRTLRQATGTDEAELIGFAMQIVKKRALSSRAALAATLEHRLDALRKTEAREEPPGRDELRDLRADLPLPESAAERVARRILRSAIPKDEQRRQAEIRALNGLRRLLRRLPDRDPKIDALLKELSGVLAQDPTEKVIVFTEYLDTLRAIQATLDSEPGLAGCYVVLTGGLTRRQRLKRQEVFASTGVRVLLATDAASEGLNLQHYCHRVVHFELPWNPNRLEQRNGRVDRYGQTREPVIRYLYYPDSPEDDVLARLVEKIEQMARDRVSTPDILGVLAGKGDIEDGLLELDPEGADVLQRKASLVHLFEDRTQEFVRNLQPLVAGGPSAIEEQDHVLGLLNTTELLLPDEMELERIVVETLGAGAKPDSERPGIYRIEVPLAWRGQAVDPVYPAATFRRSVAVRYRADEVAYVTPLHSLVQALAADARRRLAQVYPSVRGLPPRRLAGRTVDAGEVPSIVFTFLASVEGGGGVLEERMLAVQVGVDGSVSTTPAEESPFLQARHTSGEVSREVLERLFSSCFEAMCRRAEEAAASWLRDRVLALRTERCRKAAVLRRDLEVDVTDRLEEISEEEKRARGAGQLTLFPEGDAGGAGFEARRAAVETYRTHRLEDINLYEQVDEPRSPRSLGALFLVPEGGEL